MTFNNDMCHLLMTFEFFFIQPLLPLYANIFIFFVQTIMATPSHRPTQRIKTAAGKMFVQRIVYKHFIEFEL